MKVGALEETITVSGETPQIDVQQASRTQVITRDIIDTLPVSRNVMSIGVLSAGVRPGTPDIGGSRMTEQVACAPTGSRGDDAEQLVEGMSIQSSRRRVAELLRRHAAVGNHGHDGAIPADTSGGGIRMNCSAEGRRQSVQRFGVYRASAAAIGRATTSTTPCARAEQHPYRQRHQAHPDVHRIAGWADQEGQVVVHRDRPAPVVGRNGRERARQIHAPQGDVLNSYLRHLRARPLAAPDVAGGAETQARELRAAVVEAEGHATSPPDRTREPASSATRTKRTTTSATSSARRRSRTSC